MREELESHGYDVDELMQESITDTCDMGACTTCGYPHEDFLEPDATNVKCTECGHNTVQSIQSLLLGGELI